MKKWLVCLLTVFAFAFSGCQANPDALLQNEDGKTLSAEEEGGASDGAASSGQADEEDAPSAIFAYVCGAVQNPGVYQLPPESRVYQLVDMAGGLTQEADEGSVNLAQPVADGEMVRILTQEESAAGAEVSVGGTEAAAAAEPARDAGGKININTADAAELTSLSGIGEVKAASIVEYREEHGSFQSIEEITQVSGIGDATFDKIKEDITV